MCVRIDGTTYDYKPGAPYPHPNYCSTCKDWMAWMHVSHNPTDGELAPYRPDTTLVVNGVAMGVNPNPPDGPLGNDGDQCVRKDDCWRVSCSDPGQRMFYAVEYPRVEERTVSTPCPSPTPTPGPTPTPAPGCPALFKVGGMFLSATDCGQNCRKQGYLGVRVNYTATELCREGDPGCVCDPARNRCEMPRQCQNPNGADTFITLQGHFTNDECDRNSDNYFNCHHKPKKAEAGVTLFTSTPWQEPKNPWDSRGVTNCVDVQEHGTRQLARDSQACKDALAAAGR